MAVVTLPSIEKGTPATITMTLADLFALVGTPFYTDTDNLREIKVLYKSTVNSQKAVVRFTDLSGATTQGTLLLDTTADDTFQVQRVIIRDKQNGKFKVERAELNTVEFDFTASDPVSGTLSVDFLNTDQYLAGFDGEFVDDIVSFNVWMKVDSSLDSTDLHRALIAVNKDGAKTVGFTRDSGTLKFVVDDGGAGKFYNFGNISEIAADTWRMVTLVSKQSAGTTDVYLDGSLLFQASAPFHQESYDLIFTDVSGLVPDNTFINTQKVSDIAVFNKELLSGEITTLYNSRSYVNPQSSGISNLVHHYDFNGDNGTTTTTVPDLVGAKDLTVFDGGTGLATTMTLDAEGVDGES